MRSRFQRQRPVGLTEAVRLSLPAARRWLAVQPPGARNASVPHLPRVCSSGGVITGEARMAVVDPSEVR
jgi:hypothetical protein